MMKIFKYIIFLFALFSISISTMAVEISAGQQSLQFHGYFRSTLGLSKNGDTQAKFQLPEARAKYRLGNEPETNMELQFNYTYKLINF